MPPKRMKKVFSEERDLIRQFLKQIAFPSETMKNLFDTALTKLERTKLTTIANKAQELLVDIE